MLKTTSLRITIFLFLTVLPNPGFTEESSKVPISRKNLISTFEKGELVQGVIINGEDLIHILFETNHDIKIKNAVIEHGLDFTRYPLQKVISNRIQIIHSEIKSIHESAHAVIASNLEFARDFSFQETVIHGDVDFSLSRFQGSADFTRMSFLGHSDYIGTLFEGQSDFSESTFVGDSAFNAATFRGDSDFSLAIFQGDVDFELSTFFEHIDFDRSIFKGLAYFKKSAFKNRLSLRSAEMKGYVDFRETTIGELDWDASQSSPVVVKGRIDFRKAIIRDAHIQDIIFEADVDFSDAILLSSFMLRDVVFEGGAYFLRTNFSYQSGMENVRFKSEADFTNASFRITQKFVFSYVHFNDLKMSWNQLPGIPLWLHDSEEKVTSFMDLEKQEEGEITPSKIGRIEPLSQALSGLETRFRTQNQLDDANEAYYHAQKIELDFKRKDKALTDRSLMTVLWFIWWVTTGFGMRIWWIIAWCVGVNLFFSLVYFLGGDLQASEKPDNAFRLRLFDFPINYFSQKDSNNPPRTFLNFFNIFWFSSVVLLKIGIRGNTLSGKVLGINYELIILFEWLVGFYFLAALSVTLTNTVPIVNRLVTGIF